MNNDFWLSAAGAAITYFVQVAAAVMACAAVARLANGARLRFLLWQSFVLGALGFWVYRLFELFSLPRPSLPAVAPAAESAAFGIPVASAWVNALGAITRSMAAIYFVVAALFVLRLTWRHIRLRRMLRHARMAPAEARDILQGLSPSGAAPALRVLPGIAAPATCGLFRSTILLPEALEESSSRHLLSYVLPHELAHVARRDCFWSALTDLAQSLLFFHPAIRYARRQLILQRELACDSLVVGAQPESRADYAECLTRFARMRMLSDAAPVGIDFAADSSFLGRRVRAVLAARPETGMALRILRAGLAAVIAAGFAALSPLLVIWIVASPPPLVATTLVASPAHARRLRTHRPHSRMQVLRSAPSLATGEFAATDDGPRVAQRPAIFPPDGALSDEVYSGNITVEQSETGTLVDRPDVVRPMALPFPMPAVSARRAMTRSVIENVAGILRTIDRDARQRGNH